MLKIATRAWVLAFAILIGPLLGEAKAQTDIKLKRWITRCIVGMEACLSAHFVSRTLRELGFEPRIIPAIYVKPFNKGQKNDYNDAELTCGGAELSREVAANECRLSLWRPD